MMRENKKLWLYMILAAVVAVSSVFSGCDKDDDKVKVTGLQLCPSSMMLLVDGNVTLSKQVIPFNADNTTVTWTSSNEAIAAVDNDGVVTAKSIGETIITCKTEDGGFTQTCTVIVNPERNDDDYATLIPGFYFGGMTMETETVAENSMIAVKYNSNNKAVLSVDDSFTVAQMGGVQVPLKVDCDVDLTKIDDAYQAIGNTTVTLMGMSLPVGINAVFDGANNAKITINVQGVPAMGNIVVNFDGTKQMQIENCE